MIVDYGSYGSIWFDTDQQGTVYDLTWYDSSSKSYLVTHRYYDSYGVLESDWHGTTPYIETIFGYQGMMCSIYDMKLLAAGATQLYVDKYFTIERVYDPSTGGWMQKDKIWSGSISVSVLRRQPHAHDRPERIVRRFGQQSVEQFDNHRKQHIQHGFKLHV